MQSTYTEWDLRFWSGEPVTTSDDPDDYSDKDQECPSESDDDSEDYEAVGPSCIASLAMPTPLDQQLLRRSSSKRGRRSSSSKQQEGQEESGRVPDTRKRAGRKRPTRAGRKRTRLPDTRKTWKRRARARGVHCSGNTRPDEDVGRVGPRQLDAATSQAPMEEEPDWSCDNQSVDGCLPSHAPTEAMQITEGSSPTKGGQAPEARKEPEEWAQCNKGDKWPRSGEEQDWANDAQSVDDSVHPSIATALESVTTGTSIKGLLLGGRAEQPRTQVESRKEHSADVVRPKAVQLSGIEHRTRSEERVREGAGHSHQVGQSRTNPPRTHHNLILTNKHEQSYLV